MSLGLQDEVQYLKGVGPSIAEKLSRLGIKTIWDLLCFFPRDYEDRRKISLLSEARGGERATFWIRVLEHDTFFFNGRHHPRIKIGDQSGTAYLYCFNRGYITNNLRIGESFFLTGIPSRKYNRLVFTRFDYIPDNDRSQLRILPVYPLTEGLTQKKLRKLIEYALGLFADHIDDDLPQFIREGYRIGKKGELIQIVHFPPDMNALRRAKEALSYSEFFKYQLIVALSRAKTLSILKRRRKSAGDLKKRFLDSLPFNLTSAQKRVLVELEEDMSHPVPMNRLIQGDVGCGKTIVALAASLDVIECGGQVAIMAPTEVLATQHLNTISFFISNLDLRVGYLSGSVRGSNREEILESLRSGKLDIIIGTHALFSEDVVFKALELVIIDEQQKFGVLQRGRLREKGDHPDCIVMSATPIPRTLSMTLYGDLDVSVIDELPVGRGGVETIIVRQAEEEKVFDKVRSEVTRGRQAYFVYPLIEESTAIDLKNAIDAYERLRNEVFKEFRVGLLHGRMSDEEKEEVMKRFKERELDILVSTTVIEVGIDIPNATVMVIEQAERFGLSSIHQLRGRIGRGEERSYCFLIPGRSSGMEVFNRLRILRDTNDGFKIAEWDLRLRGPGELIGKRQSGIPSFLMDDLDINTKLISRAQKDARRFVSGEIGTEEERKKYLDRFIRSDFYRNAVLFYGG
ncbi:MAG: ATP-dependent DNA helicase RecG [Spirochaetota bacterium]